MFQILKNVLVFQFLLLEQKPKQSSKQFTPIPAPGFSPNDQEFSVEKRLLSRLKKKKKKAQVVICRVMVWSGVFKNYLMVF